MALVPATVKEWSSSSVVNAMSDGRINMFISRAKLKIEAYINRTIDLNDQHMELIQYELTELMILADDETIIGADARNIKTESDEGYTYSKEIIDGYSTGFTKIDTSLRLWLRNRSLEEGGNSGGQVRVMLL